MTRGVDQMKCIAIFNEKGKMIAAKRFDNPEFDPDRMDAPRILPVTKPGHMVVEIDLPQEYARLLPEDFIYKLNIECEAKLKRIKETPQ